MKVKISAQSTALIAAWWIARRPVVAPEVPPSVSPDEPTGVSEEGDHSDE